VIVLVPYIFDMVNFDISPFHQSNKRQHRRINTRKMPAVNIAKMIFRKTQHGR